ncbi:MAG: EamA family transporter [Bacteroidetes bacterium]|jgi:drug/metabolite transporter (DMT)-like permease|nr:EamA family transporter [Bacteroidota bacterium]
MDQRPEKAAPSRGRMIAGFIVICLIWGSTWLAIKEGLDSIPPFLGAALRFVAASFLLRLVMWQQGERPPRTTAYWWLMFETGMLSSAVPFGLVYWGQGQISSGMSAILFATFPFFVAIAARLRIPGDRLTITSVTGILLGFAGVLSIFWSELFADHASPMGMAAVVLSAGLQAYALITIRLKAAHLHSATLTYGNMVVGAIVLGAASLALEDLSTARFDARAVISVLYLAAFGTVVTFVIYYWLVKHMHPVVLALSAFITPILAVTLGSFVLNERLGGEVLGGSALVLLGVLVANAPGLRGLLSRTTRSAVS